MILTRAGWCKICFDWQLRSRLNDLGGSYARMLWRFFLFARLYLCWFIVTLFIFCDFCVFFFFSLNQRNLIDITQIDGIFAKLWLNCITNNWIIVLFIVTTKIFSNQKHSTKKWRKKHQEKVVKSALNYLSAISLRWSASQSTGTNFRTF